MIKQPSKKLFSLILITGLYITSAYAQALTMPGDVQTAYSKGTRSLDGKPGKKYWQNHGKYNIHITVTPPGRNINGIEDIVYTNNSPDTLKSLNMKLIMNVHRQTGRRGTAGNPALGITVDDIQANGTKLNWDNSVATTTNYMVYLVKPLMPHSSVKLDIKWHYELSNGLGREGYIDSTTFYMAYFYPRVSVYDDYKGWDTQPHNGGLEFYNDFNDYVLNVTVPKNYIVWATGDLQDAKKVLQPEFASRLQRSFTSDSTIHIATVQDLAAKNITAQNDNNTWTWTSNHISDVALAIGNHYVWDAASVVVDDKTQRRASIQAAFADSSQDFHHSVQFSHHALGWFSNNWPGVPYPFSKSTAVQGFADMEYPMMVNDSHTKDMAFAQLVQDHEQAHTYFPFYMGTNESRYAFMDEGWATTLEYLIGLEEKGKKVADEFYKTFRVNSWTLGKHDKENAIITPSNEVTAYAGANSYDKPSLSYLALKDMLGDDLFKKALHTYMDNWHGKHPIPWDYFNSMNAGSGKNLNWFFYNWFFTTGHIDLAINKVTLTNTGTQVDIKNVGGFAIPFDVVVTYADGTSKSYHQTPAVWERSQTGLVLNLPGSQAVTEVKLDGGIFVDATEADNSWKK